MRCSSKQTDKQTGSEDIEDCTLAKPLAPEEIRPGDFVSLLQVTYEMPSYFWCADTALLEPHELVRLGVVPESGGMPLKVKSVCLPFVLVKLPTGEKQSVDIRRCRLARLKKSYATAAWKAYKKKKMRDRIC